MEFDTKEILGLITVILSVGATIPYLIHTYRGIIKPHMFTWVIWTLTTFIAAAGRTAGHAGAGAWYQWISGGCCFAIALLALWQGERDITRSDWLVFICALLAIPAWAFTENPLYAIIIVTTIDVIGYIPTLRKSWDKPDQEAMFNYVVSNIIHVISIFATITFSLTTLLFPVALFVANTALVATLIVRRKHKANLLLNN